MGLKTVYVVVTYLNEKKKQMERKGMRIIFMCGGINNLINTFMIFVIKQLGQNYVEIRSL